MKRKRGDHKFLPWIERKGKLFEKRFRSNRNFRSRLLQRALPESVAGKNAAEIRVNEAKFRGEKLIVKARPLSIQEVAEFRLWRPTNTKKKKKLAFVFVKRRSPRSAQAEKNRARRRGERNRSSRLENVRPNRSLLRNKLCPAIKRRTCAIEGTNERVLKKEFDRILSLLRERFLLPSLTLTGEFFGEFLVSRSNHAVSKRTARSAGERTRPMLSIEEAYVTSAQPKSR